MILCSSLATVRIQNEGSTVMDEEHEYKITPSLDGKPTHGEILACSFSS